MNFNATFFGQLIAFAVFVWFCMKFVWPLVLGKIQEREKHIADGLAAAAKGRQTLEEARETLQQSIAQGKEQAAGLVRQGERRREELIEQARTEADIEGKRRLQMAEQEMDRIEERVRQQLGQRLAALAIAGAERILQSEVDSRTHNEMLEQLGNSL